MSTRRIAIAAGLLGALLCAVVGAIVFAADIDNCVHIFCARDLQVVQSFRVADGTIGSVLGARLRDVRWSAYHAGDALYLTVVDCRGYDDSRHEQLFSWEVARNHSPLPEMPRIRVRVTALTRQAALLTPNTVPHGLDASDYPDDKFRLWNSTAIFGLAKLRSAANAGLKKYRR